MDGGSESQGDSATAAGGEGIALGFHSGSLEMWLFLPPRLELQEEARPNQNERSQRHR